MDAAMNHDSIIPLYAQVEEQLRRDIENGVYSKNGRIPTEAELAKQYNVSRITVRRAVEDLVGQGLVEKKQGKGTFVTAHKFSRRLDTGPMGFTEMCESVGLTPSAQNLKAEICVPKSAQIRSFLQLQDREPAIHISRLR